jgi:hypothetical protein
MYMTGDTLVIDALKEIPRRYPDIDLALLHWVARECSAFW